MKSGLEVDAMLARLPSRAPAVSEPREGEALAWQREMERAQMEAWLSHATVGFAGVRPAIPNDASATSKLIGHPTPLDAAAAAVPAARNVRLPKAALPADKAGSNFGGAVQHRAPWTPVDRPGTSPDLIGRAQADGPRGADIAAARVAAIHAEPASTMAREQAPPLREPGGQHSNPDMRGRRTEQLVSLLQRFGAVGLTTAAEHPAGVDAASQLPIPAKPTSSNVPALSALAVLPRSPAASASEYGVVAGVLPTAIAPVHIPIAAATPNGIPSQRAGQAFAIAEASLGSSESAAGMSRGRVGAPREPIRLHADWNAEGVHLWLGMDASQLASLHSMTVQLQRWLSTQGLKLLSMSCNGRVVVEQARERADSDAFEGEIEQADAAPAQTIPTLKEFP